MKPEDINFDDVYFEGETLCLYKGTGEESGFIIKIGYNYQTLWSIPQYGGFERCEKSWNYSDPLEAVKIALTWT